SSSWRSPGPPACAETSLPTPSRPEICSISSLSAALKSRMGSKSRAMEGGGHPVHDHRRVLEVGCGHDDHAPSLALEQLPSSEVVLALPGVALVLPAVVLHHDLLVGIDEVAVGQEPA